LFSNKDLDIISGTEIALRISENCTYPIGEALSMRKATLVAFALLLTFGLAPSARADTTYIFGYTYSPYAFPPNPTLTLTDIEGDVSVVTAEFTGWYDSSGFHDATNPNYFAALVDGTAYNDFFVYFIPAAGGIYVSATLNLWNPTFGWYSDSYASVVYSNWDVTTPISTLEATNSGAVGIFDDLDSGVFYASTLVGSWDDGTYVNIPLDAAALASINAAGVAADHEWAVGGTIVPEPSSLLLFGSGIMGLAGMIRRRLR
jgi:hypothetical protein